MKSYLTKTGTMKYYIFLFFLFARNIFAQGYGDPLTMQGIDHTSLHSAASRAAGGTSLMLRNQAATMFSNPASLQTVKTPQAVVGGTYRWIRASQEQQFAPLKYYSNYSLLMEGLTGNISDPDTSIPNPNPNPGDTVQRPFDTIKPNWSNTKNGALKGEFFLALPIVLGSANITAGLGFVEYANLNKHFENHNVTSPSVGSERPVPVARPSNDSLPFITHWSSYMQSREGSIRGYGLALSGELSESITIGLSAMILDGSSDDYEQRIERGTLTFYRDWFRIDSVYGHSVKSGISEYSGFEASLGCIYRGPHVSLAFTVKPPTTITRSYSTTEYFDTTGSSTAVTVHAEDKLTLPWRGSIGLGLALRENVTCAIEYEIRTYTSATYQDPSGMESNPWLSASILNIGAEFIPNDWLALRAGARQQSEVFEQEGNPLEGEPVTYSVYSAGCGVTFSSVQVNLAYEYSLMKYQDMWQTNVNFNRETNHTLILDVVYALPWLTGE